MSSRVLVAFVVTLLVLVALPFRTVSTYVNRDNGCVRSVQRWRILGGLVPVVQTSCNRDSHLSKLLLTSTEFAVATDSSQSPWLLVHSSSIVHRASGQGMQIAVNVEDAHLVEYLKTIVTCDPVLARRLARSALSLECSGRLSAEITSYGVSTAMSCDEIVEILYRDGAEFVSGLPAAAP